MARVVAALRADGSIDRESIDEAARVLRGGGLVAIPTETVYGLAADALNPDAVRKIFAAKGRPPFNPLIVHVLDVAAARALTPDWSETADKLARAFWPGPLSIIVPRRPIIPLEATGGLETVALRSPSHPVARALLDASGLSLAAPSANRSNAVSPTCAEHVVASLGDRVDLVLDGGPCAVGIESTVVDSTQAPPVVLRPGGISSEALERVIGRLGTPGGSQTLASPGMLDRHYAPDADTRLFSSGELPAVLSTLPKDARVAGLVRGLAPPADGRIVAWEVLGDSPLAYATRLYAALHRFEGAHATHVLLETVPDAPAWAAIADRLKRAAGPGRS